MSTSECFHLFSLDVISKTFPLHFWCSNNSHGRKKTAIECFHLFCSRKLAKREVHKHHLDRITRCALLSATCLNCSFLLPNFYNLSAVFWPSHQVFFISLLVGKNLPTTKTKSFENDIRKFLKRYPHKRFLVLVLTLVKI